MNSLTVFVGVSAIMLTGGLAWVLWPLVRRGQTAASSSASIITLVVASVLVLTVALYVHVNNWSWSDSPPAQTNPASPMSADVQAQITAFKARVDANPGDSQGWLLLGNALMQADEVGQASSAYNQAFDLTHGNDLDARAALIEALVLANPNAINDRAVTLLDEGLKLAPQHPKLLWYGGLVALQSKNLGLARERFQAMLKLDPPNNVRVVLEQQIAQLNQQLGEPAAQQPPVNAETQSRKVRVAVSLSPSLKSKITTPMSLFVLARNPNQPGPPLAVQRHQSTELPLAIELTRDDAMLPSRTLQTADEVEIVARLSSSGMPTEQPGDYFGKARYSFARQGEQGSVSIEINQQVH